MPQLFRFGAYLVYFWANESEPLEPLHVHISEGKQNPNATKIWITRKGKCVLAHNRSGIPASKLNSMMKMLEVNSLEIINAWKAFFGEIHYIDE